MKRIFGEVRVGATEQKVSSSYFENVEEAKHFIEGWYKKALQRSEAIFAYARVVTEEGIEMFFDPRKEVWIEI